MMGVKVFQQFHNDDKSTDPDDVPNPYSDSVELSTLGKKSGSPIPAGSAKAESPTSENPKVCVTK
jgi:hypothetical protein